MAERLHLQQLFMSAQTYDEKDPGKLPMKIGLVLLTVRFTDIPGMELVIALEDKLRSSNYIMASCKMLIF